MSNYIDKTAIVEDDVVMGDNNYVGPFCLIKSGTVIGNNNRFEAYCSVGTAPEHRNYLDEYKNVVIGDNNLFREYVTINSGTVNVTTLGDNIIMLRGSHVGHDSVIENNVTLSCNVLVGGHTHIMYGANMGLGSVCHQFSIIGAFSMIGMNGVVTKKNKIEPFRKYVGIPVKDIGLNNVAIEKNGVSDEQYIVYVTEYDKLTNK